MTVIRKCKTMTKRGIKLTVILGRFVCNWTGFRTNHLL